MPAPTSEDIAKADAAKAAKAAAEAKAEADKAAKAAEKAEAKAEAKATGSYLNPGGRATLVIARPTKKGGSVDLLALDGETVLVTDCPSSETPTEGHYTPV